MSRCAHFWLNGTRCLCHALRGGTLCRSHEPTRKHDRIEAAEKARDTIMLRRAERLKER